MLYPLSYGRVLGRPGAAKGGNLAKAACDGKDRPSEIHNTLTLAPASAMGSLPDDWRSAMFAPAKTACPRRRTAPFRRRRTGQGLAFGLALFALAGCDTTIQTLVGKQTGTDKPSAPVTPPAPLPTTAFITDNNLSPGFTNQTIVPPTLPPEPGEENEAAAEPVATTGPRHALAAAALSTDAASFAALAAAAHREKDLPDARFVLLVLSPPALDAAAMDRGNTAARQAANAALKALSDAGIPAEHVEVSLATSANVGNGELRLYRR
jgi:hypothetical protein